MRKLKFILTLFTFSALLVSCREEAALQNVGLYKNGECIVWTEGWGLSGLRIIFADINGFSEKEILNIAKSLYFISNANSCESIGIYEEKDLETDGFSTDVMVYNISVPNTIRSLPNRTSHKYKEKRCNLENINIEADDTNGFKISKVDEINPQFSYGDKFKIDGIVAEIVSEHGLYTCILTEETLSENQIVELYKMVEKGQLKSVTNIYLFDHRCSIYMSGKEDYAALQPENKLIFHFVTNETFSISNNYALKKLKI